MFITVAILGKSTRPISSIPEALTSSRYLCTLAAAEQLYDAVHQIHLIGSLVIDALSLAFFQDLDPLVEAGRYSASSEVYSNMTAAMLKYADGYLSIVHDFTPTDGSLAEQYFRDDGSPLSAAALTWCRPIPRP